MNPQNVFCPNLDCPARGQQGKGNNGVQSQQEKRYICHECGQTFSATKGSIFYWLHTDPQTVLLVIALLVYGCPLKAIVKAFGLDERTVKSWWQRAGRHCQPLLDTIAYHKLTERVHFLGSVPDEDLVVLYNMALFLAYPSLYEGFGLPILEAMACGCPVLTSNVSSMPEVAGNAALLVDPNNLEEIISGMGRMLDLRFAQNLREKGLIRASEFSWDHKALSTLAIYKSINV